MPQPSSEQSSEILFSYETMSNMRPNPYVRQVFQISTQTEKVSNNIWLLVGI